jgi:hypothetical protein
MHNRHTPWGLDVNNCARVHFWLIAFTRSHGTASNGATTLSHDSGNTWHPRNIPTAGTVVAMNPLERTPSHMARPPGHVASSKNSTHRTPPKSTPIPFNTHITRPSHFILTKGKLCGYTSAEGKACLQDLSLKECKDVARHWFTCHAMREVKDILRNQLDLEKATIINTEARQLVAEMYLVRCPLQNCKSRDDPDALFVRPDVVQRHMETASLHGGRSESKQNARMWTHTNMELLKKTTPVLFSDKYETAAWRIYCAG